MVDLHDLVRISDYEWEIPKTFRQDMHVPVRIFATRKLLEAVMDDKSLEQAVNAATLPGLVGHVLVMPDMHQGYGFPDRRRGCHALPGRRDLAGRHRLRYQLRRAAAGLCTSDYEDVADRLDALATALDHYCPSGVGAKGASAT